MASKIKLTQKQIRQIVADYHAAFQEWLRVGDDMLIRVEGVVGQSIWFDRLRTGRYRPSARVNIFAAPDNGGGILVLHQFLGIKNKEINPSFHTQKLPSVVNALKTEITPSTVEMLDARMVADLLSREAVGRPAAAYALACLNAALGIEDAARRWIVEYHAAWNALVLDAQPSDNFRSTLLGQVEKWLDQGSSVDELAAIARVEQAKLFART